MTSTSQLQADSTITLKVFVQQSTLPDAAATGARDLLLNVLDDMANINSGGSSLEWVASDPRELISLSGANTNTNTNTKDTTAALAIRDAAKRFEADYGVPYTPLNVRNMRLRMISIADAVVGVVPADEAGTYELAFNTHSRNEGPAPMFLVQVDVDGEGHNTVSFTHDLDHAHAPGTLATPVIKYFHLSTADAKAGASAHIKTQLKQALTTFFAQCRQFHARTQNTDSRFSRMLPLRKLGAETSRKQQLMRTAQFPIHNIDATLTRYHERFVQPNSGLTKSTAVAAHGDAAMLLDSMPKARLVLKSGLVMEGYSFGAPLSRSGEAVFNTCMVGYVESLSDPSYHGQILVCSSTLQGNYGVPDAVRDRYGLLKHFESEDMHVSGLVVTDYAWNYSHWQAVQSLSQWLKEYNVPAIYGFNVDTRELVQHLRDNGSQLAKIVQSGDEGFLGVDSLSMHSSGAAHPAMGLGSIGGMLGISAGGAHPPATAAGGMMPFSSLTSATATAAASAAASYVRDFEDPNLTNLSSKTCVRHPVDFEGNSDIRILLVDYGVKQSIVRCLLDRGMCVRVVPWDWDLSKEKFDGLMLSNGPGDPSLLDAAVEQIRSHVENESRVIPLFGVCMGNQLLGRAVGAQTYKMKFGNRGHNQPVVDLTTGRCYITSQNHGYAIDAETLPWDWEQLFVNLNDHSNEGIRHKSKPFFSCQFHPEARGGPLDTRFLFDMFIRDVVQAKYVTPFTQTPRVRLLLMGHVEGQERRRPGEHMLVHGATKVVPTATAATRSMPPPLTLGAGGGAGGGSNSNSNNAQNHQTTTHPTSTYMLRFRGEQAKVRKVLVLGSGALSIGQAGEFDYSGCQAIAALREEQIKSVLVNPNIATIQTGMSQMADQTYLVPLTVESVTAVIAKERPDGIFLSFGGQTALNLGIRLRDEGVLDKYNVQVLGTPIRVIEATEDRELFNQKLAQISEPIALGRAATSVEEAVSVAGGVIGYPVIVRAAYALGGLGSGFAHNEKELRDLCNVAFATSPQVLVERDLRGWKELEYEVVRDAYDNCIVVAALENFNPMGIHTGESIVVTPLQTISDEEHFNMRAKAMKIIRHLGVVGECNIQFALNPHSREIVVIEVNARLSRSSALASKATGYPLAFVSAKLALGYPLPVVANNVTKATTAFFEPSLDYVVVKIPRWDLLKFSNVSRKVGSAMKSVGEIMSVGRTFEEALQKGLRMTNPTVDGFEPSPESLARHEFSDPAKRDEELKNGTDRQIFCLAQALIHGVSVEHIHSLSRIDRWFLSKLQRIVDIRNEIVRRGSLHRISIELMRDAKSSGFSDKQIASLLNQNSNSNSSSGAKSVTELDVRHYRKQLNVVPSIKRIDTLGGEWPSVTNYLYMSYAGVHNDVQPFAQPPVIVVGSGCYRIGSSVEFDWCGVQTVNKIREQGVPTVMINNNPETVSTDHVMCNRLYFEEISLERVLDIYEAEKGSGGGSGSSSSPKLCLAVGGQIANNLAVPLSKAGVVICGSSAESVDAAENRSRFSSILDECGVHQPPWSTLQSVESGLEFADKVGYPVVVRPSYVLSGAAMRVAISGKDMHEFLVKATEISPDFPVVVSKFMEGSMEIDFDGVCQDGKLLAYAISQHVEDAGVHSGDATHVLPAPDVQGETYDTIVSVAREVGKRLNVNGPFNMQFMLVPHKQEQSGGGSGSGSGSGSGARHTLWTPRTGPCDLMVIECNVRASRSLPFVSKTIGIDMIELAVKVFLGIHADPIDCRPATLDLQHYGVKAPMYSFKRLAGADPVLGVEMASTGEVGCLGADPHQALLMSLLATGCVVVDSSSVVLVLAEHLPSLVKFAAAAEKLASRVKQLVLVVPGHDHHHHRHGAAAADATAHTTSDSTSTNTTDSSASDDDASAAPATAAASTTATTTTSSSTHHHRSGAHKLNTTDVLDQLQAHKWATVVSTPAAEDMIEARKIRLAISFSSPHAVQHNTPDMLHTFARLRRRVVDLAVPTILDANVASWYAEALSKGSDKELNYTMSLQRYHHEGAMGSPTQRRGVMQPVLAGWY